MRLIFVSNREGGAGMGDFYISHRTNPNNDLGWGPPQRIPEISSPSDDFGPWGFEHPETGELVLYFNSDRAGGLGGHDIYAARLQEEGTFSTPQLVEEVSSGAGDLWPILRGDGLEMFLTSGRPGGMGGNDIWVAHRGSLNDQWSVPVNVGSTINSGDLEQRSSITANGLEMVFFSNRAGGLGAVDLYQSSRRQAALIPVAGSVTGAFGTTFRTWARLTNATDETVSGSLVFRPAGTQPSSSDPVLSYTLAPFETLTHADLFAQFGVTGVGSLEVHPAMGAAPAISVRIDNGRSVFVPQAMEEHVLSAGTAGVLPVPDLTQSRLNVGMRALQAGATLTAELRNADGDTLHSQTHVLPPNFFIQIPANQLVSGDAADGVVVVIRVSSGSAVVYGSAVSHTGGNNHLMLATRTELE